LRLYLCPASGHRLGETLGENLEGWTSYEPFECETCGRVGVTSSLGENEHRDVEPRVFVRLPEDDGVEFVCSGCEETVTFHADEDGDFVCPECQGTFMDGDEVENTCSGYVNSDGPMMNYWYPVHISDCKGAAEAISHTCLCVVEFEDGQTGLALTGGGMDLSRDICSAFIALGYFPPAHYAGRLPRFAGDKMSPAMADLLGVCLASCEVAVQWAQYKVQDVENFIKQLEERS